ncbi:hypothetical protein BD626DRAFT_629551 [Schizophyllum amplum]|uniref:MYND-type domain-containing protein n=1 Tax=Schizophyllum amplum TaxID=97359 RepID=A0A550CG30_9AGAR|nr:hypothetical protein BD626DRAFT_629551 [Auriculariopsis ampla]
MPGSYKDIQALGNAINKIQVFHPFQPNDPRLQPPLRDIQTLLQRRPFDIMHADTPSMPLDNFLNTTEGDEIFITLKIFSALHKLSVQEEMEHEHLWEHDAATWINVFRWAEYLCPLYQAVSCPSDQIDIMGTVIRVLEALITDLDDFKVFSLLVDTLAYLPFRLAADIWEGWPRIYDNGACSLTPKSKTADCVRQSIAILQRIYDLLSCKKEETYPAMRSELLRVARGRPRRLHRIVGRNIQTLIALEDGTGYLLWTQMYFSTQLILLEVGTDDISKTALRSVVDILRHYPAFEKMMSADAFAKVREAAISMLAMLCGHHFTASVDALCLGAFPLCTQIRARFPADDPDNYELLSEMFDNVLFSRRAPDRKIQVTAATRFSLLEEAKADWDRVGKVCCNIDSGECKDGPVCACPCSQALYCSTHCQRAHWTDGEHSKLCPFSEDSDADLPPEPISPKDLRFLVLITRAYVEKHIASIYNPEKGLGACAVDLTGPEPTHTTYALPDPPPVVDWPLVSVQALYRDSSTRKRACKVVLYGGPQMRYRMLNQARFVLPEMRVRIVHDPSSE